MYKPIRSRVFIIAFIGGVSVTFFCFLTVSARETPRNERNIGGTLINQDYFTANQYPEVKQTLYLVEIGHMNQRVWNDLSAGRYGATLGDVKYTLDKFPNHPNALLLMGSVARLTGNLSLPIPYYEKALKLYPQYASTHAQYGSYLVDVGLVEAGIGKLKQAIEMDPQLTSAHAWLAGAYYKSGNSELARQAAEQARRLGYKGRIPGREQEK